MRAVITTNLRHFMFNKTRVAYRSEERMRSKDAGNVKQKID